MASYVNGVYYGGNTSGYTAYLDEQDVIAKKLVAAAVVVEDVYIEPPVVEPIVVASNFDLYGGGDEGAGGGESNLWQAYDDPGLNLNEGMLSAEKLTYDPAFGSYLDKSINENDEFIKTTPYDWGNQEVTNVPTIPRFGGMYSDPVPTVVPEVPSFGGMYSDPVPSVVPEVPSFGGMYQDPPGPTLIDPDDPAYWGAWPGAHGENDDSVPMPGPVASAGFGWPKLPDLSVPGFEWPSLSGAVGTIFPLAGGLGAAGGAAAETVGKGMDFMQMMLIMSLMKD